MINLTHINLTDKVSIAWWLKPYCYGLAIVSALTGREPDWDKVARMVDRAITAKITRTSEGIGGA